MYSAGFRSPAEYQCESVMHIATLKTWQSLYLNSSGNEPNDFKIMVFRFALMFANKYLASIEYVQHIRRIQGILFKLLNPSLSKLSERLAVIHFVRLNNTFNYILLKLNIECKCALICNYSEWCFRSSKVL